MNPATRLLLIVSLALNLALGGGLAWWAWQNHQAQSMTSTREGRPMFHPDALRGALHGDRGALVDRVVAHHRERMRSQIQALRQARRDVQTAMLAEPFQREQLDAAFSQLRAAETLTATEAHALVGDLVEQAEPRERQRMARLVDGGRGRHRMRPPPPSPPQP
ncbi:MAG: periplasmic heavy metal sensor [Xanthomonadales bacterium]|nr:periplasmic heavy metal sensor [Xanthomonadales bacterium]